MKRTVSVFLIVFLTTFSIFPWSKDKYSKIVDKVFQEIKQNETSDDVPSTKESGLTTKEKIVLGIGIGTAAVAGAKLAWDKLSKDKYEKAAEKAFEAVKDTK